MTSVHAWNMASDVAPPSRKDVHRLTRSIVPSAVRQPRICFLFIEYYRNSIEIEISGEHT